MRPSSHSRSGIPVDPSSSIANRPHSSISRSKRVFFALLTCLLVLGFYSAMRGSDTRPGANHGALITQEKSTMGMTTQNYSGRNQTAQNTTTAGHLTPAYDRNEIIPTTTFHVGHSQAESSISAKSSTGVLEQSASFPNAVPIFNDITKVYDKYVIYGDKCRIRKYDYDDAAILKKYFTKKTYTCHKEAKPFIFFPKVSLTAGRSCVGFHETVFDQSYGGRINHWNCTFKEVVRDLKSKVIDRHFNYGARKPLRAGDCLEEEFIWIECDRPGSNVTYEQPLMLPLVKATRAPIRPNNAGKKPLQVLVLGLDSVSRLNAHRQFPKTLKFLQSKQNFIELFGYNKIGLNSAPNQIPLLTGIPYAEPGLRSRVEPDYFDNQTRFLWQDYEERGYRTMYYEEKHQYGLFVYPSLKGFKKVPTTYWPRPIIQAIEDSSLRKAGDDWCIGPHFPAKYYLDYTFNTMKILGNDRPLFSYQFLVEVAHDTLNGGRRVDGYFHDFFTKMESSGILNNTAVLFISDHGFRFGEFRKTPLGRHEDMLPFGFVLMPDWYFEGKPEALKNFRTNSRRLVTVYDLHATLLELADPWSEGRVIRTANGYSILSTMIPSDRSCEEAGINFQFCACFEPQTRDTKGELSQSLAKFVIRRINDVIRENNATAKCREWSLDVVESFVRLSEGNKWTNFYKSTIRTKPNAQFEVTAELTELSLIWKLLSPIDRTSWFSSHARCVKKKSYERYCYCR